MPLPKGTDPRQREVLSRIALMSGAGYGASDIGARLWMDMGVRLSEDAVELLLAELGVGVKTPVQTLKADLLRKLSYPRAVALCDLLRKSPMEAAVQACRLGVEGLVVAAARSLPRAKAASFQAGLEVWGASRRVIFPVEVDRLASRLEISKQELLRVCPELGPREGATLGLARPLPRRANPFRRKAG